MPSADAADSIAFRAAAHSGLKYSTLQMIGGRLLSQDRWSIGYGS